MRDIPRGIDFHRVAEGYSYVPATTYSIEVRHDGTNVSVSVDGDPMTEAAASSRNTGESGDFTVDAVAARGLRLVVGLDRLDVAALAEVQILIVLAVVVGLESGPFLRTERFGNELRRDGLTVSIIRRAADQTAIDIGLPLKVPTCS